ncbi:MAG: AAA family ATPase [Armatimonadetes bacterium]|nr:AAA family ATPase [Armatimonadota bacterium]MDI9586059.1 AAA family ATPase [Acidobacteriota bacterium]
MLAHLALRSFRTCADTALNLAPVTLLIGRNNSGKTNICQALRFLSMSSTEESLDEAARKLSIPPLEVATRYQRDVQTALYVEADLPFEGAILRFRYRISIASGDPGAAPGFILNVASESLHVRDGGTEWCLIERDGHRVTLLHERKAHNHHPDCLVQTTAPPRQTMLARLYDLDDNPRANAFRNYILSWRYYSISADVIRQSRRARYDPFLSDDASNLASVLYTLKSEDTRSFNRLVQLIREIEPSLETLNFVSPRPDEVFMEAEDSEGNRYGPDSLSDGTLNYMALCYVALQGTVRTARDTPRPGLIAFEEPERGLYVGHLRKFAEVLQDAAKTQQIILTTHNPYLIDLFEDHKEQVRLVHRGDHQLRDGTSVTTPDPARLDDLLETFSLGDIYYRELLG